MLSRKFIEKLKLWPEPQYKVALRAGVHPALLSKWSIGAQTVQKKDPRIVKLGQILGLSPSECFDDQSLVEHLSTFHDQKSDHKNYALLAFNESRKISSIKIVASDDLQQKLIEQALADHGLRRK